MGSSAAPMKIMSFDIGIKNMAYCILDVSSSISIQNWDVLNLMDIDTSPMHQCSCVTIPKSKKLTPKSCIKPASYQKKGKYYCAKHAKDSTEYLIPTKQRTLTFLRKQKNEDLSRIGNSHMLFLSGVPKTKKDMIDTIHTFYENTCFENLVLNKSKNAGETELIHIGKNMKTLLNQVADIENITHVVIENQISPIANRMKTIQGMLAQYFIMKNTDTDIEFVSSSHKLNQFKDITGFSLPTKTVNEKSCHANDNVTTASASASASAYREHKKGGVEYTRQILTKNPVFENYKDALLDTKKKDDLADSFLQGLWYAKNKKYISYNNDLEISLVQAP